MFGVFYHLGEFPTQIILRMILPPSFQYSSPCVAQLLQQGAYDTMSSLFFPSLWWINGATSTTNCLFCIKLDWKAASNWANLVACWLCGILCVLLSLLVHTATRGLVVSSLTFLRGSPMQVPHSMAIWISHSQWNMIATCSCHILWIH